MLKLKKGDLLCKVKGGTGTVCRKDKWELYLLTNMHQPPTSGQYVGTEGNASKPLGIESYNSSMGFVDMSDMMVNRYGISRNTSRPHSPQHLFNSLLSHKVFREQLVSSCNHAAQNINPTPSTSGYGQTSSQAVCVSQAITSLAYQR
jgi:hypothetical protein